MADDGTTSEYGQRRQLQGRSRPRQQMGEDRGRHDRVLTGDGLQGQRRRRRWRPLVGIDDEDGNAERMKRRPAEAGHRRDGRCRRRRWLPNQRRTGESGAGRR
ncbi:hypothetical protein E2562_019582 [Oryza meyeriana var. granulata]|uniref:Uncharacterized protein n=1 Tax=Oryza meyeriana var. granulata TaxID=110450 RepID=A0A6G1BY37_9ORYZ|nr:hypothetical protein E2562_019582 [Oryza meyeriana var. granulata]